MSEEIEQGKHPVSFNPDPERLAAAIAKAKEMEDHARKRSVNRMEDPEPWVLLAESWEYERKIIEGTLPKTVWQRFVSLNLIEKAVKRGKPE